MPTADVSIVYIPDNFKKVFRGYLDNTERLIFWLCDMKQLNFRYFNTNSKKFTVTVNSFSRKNQQRFQKTNIILLSIKKSFRSFSDYFRFPKTTKILNDFRKLPKISEEKSVNSPGPGCSKLG